MATPCARLLGVGSKGREPERRRRCSFRRKREEDIGRMLNAE